MWRSMLGLRSGIVRAAPTGRLGATARSTFAFSNSRLASTTSKKAPKEKMTLKKLAKEYGWTATGVYIALMSIDLPLFYLLVHSTGQDNMEKVEIKVRQLIGANSDPENTYIHKAASGGKSLFLAEFGVAYILHKAFIVVRVPLTVAITPFVATKLQQWGFNVNRALPTVDKSKLATKAADANSPAVRKAAEVIAQRDHKPAEDVAKELASKAESAAHEGKKAVQDFTEKRNPGSFGKRADKKKRWWWFF